MRKKESNNGSKKGGNLWVSKGEQDRNAKLKSCYSLLQLLLLQKKKKKKKKTGTVMKLNKNCLLPLTKN